jgi:hypothetical protein
MKTINFAEWLAENHYTLYNIIDKEYYWISESDNYVPHTTEQLLKKFKNENN